MDAGRKLQTGGEECSESLVFSEKQGGRGAAPAAGQLDTAGCGGPYRSQWSTGGTGVESGKVKQTVLGRSLFFLVFVCLRSTRAGREVSRTFLVRS